MTDDNTKALADAGHIAQRRASLYHMLLKRWAIHLQTFQDERGDPCPICGDPDWFNGTHHAGCLVLDTRRALSASSDEIAAMLRELAQ